MNKARKAKKPGLTEAEKREQVRLALLKKKEYENEALKIVNRLIEEGVEEQWLIDSGKSLNESYWDDAVTERSITNMCGYPLCDDKITVKHKGKYKVSLKDNKVYDMEERNKFCTNFCFKASFFFRDQLDSSPLWLRESRDKTFLVLRKQSLNPGNVVVSGKGMVVDLWGTSGAEIKCDKNENESEDELDSDTENNKNHSETVESTVERLMESLVIKDSEEAKVESKSDLTHNNCDKDTVVRTDKSTDKMSHLKPEQSVDKDVKNVHFKEDSEKELPKKERIILPKKKRLVQQTATANPVEVVESAVRDWFSIDTYRCVVGDEHLRKTLLERNVSEETIVKTVGDPVLKQDMQAKYRALCRKIDLAEALENNAEEENDDFSNDKLPMPNYVDLQKEVETDMLKVSSYLKGKEVYEEDIGKKREIVVKENEGDDEDEPRLPLVDKYAEVALRRRIVVEKLNRSVPDVLDLLEFPLAKVRSNLKELVHSFYLTKDNVMFRPQEWSLISLVVVKLLSVTNEELKSAFKKPSSKKYLNMLLLSYQLDESFLEGLVLSLTGNIDGLLGKMANNTAAIFTA